MCNEQAVIDALIAKKGLSWQDGDSTADANATNAARSVMARLQNISGAPAPLNFERPDLLDLAVEAAWYTMEGQWPQFRMDYLAELNMLRLREGFRLGQEEADGFP